jgi:hypothetical protein
LSENFKVLSENFKVLSETFCHESYVRNGVSWNGDLHLEVVVAELGVVLQLQLHRQILEENETVNQGRLLNETFFYIQRKRASFGRTLQVPDHSFKLRTFHWGQYYNHNFPRFSAKKMALFLKTNVMIVFCLHK